MNVLAKGLYMLTIFGALFTGFGNMPLYKRYYIADLPGLGWSGDFFANLYVHMICSAVLLAVSIYFALSYLFSKKQTAKLTKTGAIRAVILALALMSGILMAVKNLPSVHFSFQLGMTFNFLHMGMAMLFLFMALICVIGRWKWVKRTAHSSLLR